MTMTTTLLMLLTYFFKFKVCNLNFYVCLLSCNCGEVFLINSHLFADTKILGRRPLTRILLAFSKRSLTSCAMSPTPVAVIH